MQFTVTKRVTIYSKVAPSLYCYFHRGLMLVVCCEQAEIINTARQLRWNHRVNTVCFWLKNNKNNNKKKKTIIIIVGKKWCILISTSYIIQIQSLTGRTNLPQGEQTCFVTSQHVDKILAQAPIPPKLGCNWQPTQPSEGREEHICMCIRMYIYIYRPHETKFNKHSRKEGTWQNSQTMK